MATPTPAVASQPEPASPVKGLIEAFVNPAELFGKLDRMPKWGWLAPIAVGIIVSVAVQYFMHPYRKPAILGMITDDMAPQMAQALRQSASQGPGQTLIWTAVFYPIGVLIGAGILTGLAAMFTAKGKYMSFFMGLSFAKLVLLPGLMLTDVILSLRGVDSVSSMMDLVWTIGPAMFVSSNKLLFNILSQFHVFEVWYLILLVILVQKVTGAKRGPAITAAVIYWIIGAASIVGMLALSGLR